MKKLTLICFVLIVMAHFLQAQTTGSIKQVMGTYTGENLYVRNSFEPNGGVLLCIYDAYLNGQSLRDLVNSSSFEIDFSNFKIKKGDPITLEFKQRNGCTGVELVNPEAILPKSTFNLENISYENGNLKWTTTNEQGSLDYMVECFRWSKWRPVGKVKGTGRSDKNTYTIPVKLNSGENKFRVKQIDYTKRPRFAEEYVFESNILEVTCTIDKKRILFSSPTIYELFDASANIIKAGETKEIDISDLKKGTYYLNYDRFFKEFEK